MISLPLDVMVSVVVPDALDDACRIMSPSAFAVKAAPAFSPMLHPLPRTVSAADMFVVTAAVACKLHVVAVPCTKLVNELAAKMKVCDAIDRSPPSMRFVIAAAEKMKLFDAITRPPLIVNVSEPSD